MSRWRAFAIHLGISLAVVGVLAFGLFYLWYPPHLLGFAGAAGLLALVAGVDIVAGPLLTLIVYKAGKKSLKFDLSVIALAQLCFLAYGLWTVWATRPVYIVAGARDFEVVFANEISAADLAQAENEIYARLPWLGPQLVSTRAPANEQERNQVLEGDLIGKGISKRPRYFQPFAEGAARTLGLARGPDAIEQFSWYVDAPVLAAVKARFAAQPETRFLPVASSRGMALYRIDMDSGEPLEYVATESTAE